MRTGNATLSNYWIRPWRKLVPRRRAVHRDENDEEQSSSALQAHTLAQRDRRLVNPQGGATTRQHNRQNPLSLDGRGIKGEGEKDSTTTPGRHTGFKAVSTGRGRQQDQYNLQNPPLPRWRPLQNLPSFPRRRETTGRATTSQSNRQVRHSRVGGNPQGRGNNKPTPTIPRPVIHSVPHRHSRVGGKPQGGVTTSPKQPPLSPSPLMEEDQSLSQCLTLGAEVKKTTQPTPSPKSCIIHTWSKPCL